MYEAQLEKDWRYIITDSDSKMIIAANDSIYKKVSEYVGKVGKVQNVLCFDTEDEYIYSYNRYGSG